MIYFLDANIFLTLVRNADFEAKFYKIYPEVQNQMITSVVVEGELKSFIVKRNWGSKKQKSLLNLLDNSIIYPIKTEAVIDKYAEIDAYSQGKHPTITLPISARNMGKNDLWIAATASVLEATLLTMDKDFDHLNDVFLTVEWIDLRKLG